MRLLIVSDSPALRSGLARVTRELATRWNRDGVDVAVAGWFHDIAPFMEEEPCLILPAVKNQPETVDRIIDQIEPEVVLAIGDPWDFKHLAQRRAQRGGFRLVGYINIEGGPLPGALESTLDAFDFLAVSSEFGARVVNRPGMVAVHHGVDTATFYPRPPAPDALIVGRKAAETFIVLVNAQNVQRKNIAAAVLGYAEFAKGRTDTLLYLNTQMGPDPSIMEGTDLVELVNALEIGNQVVATHDSGPLGSFTDASLNEAYGFSSVLLVTSLGEGFCLPVLEAMATDTVPVATWGFAMPELLADDRGIPIPPSTTFRGYHGIDLCLVHPDVVARSLEQAYVEWKTGQLTTRAIRGRLYASFKSWDRTYEALDVLVREHHVGPRVASGQPIDPSLRQLARRRTADGPRLGILKLGGIGDLLQLTAVVAAARQKYDLPTVVCSNNKVVRELFPARDGIEPLFIGRQMAQEEALRSLQPCFSVFLDVRYVSMVYGDQPTTYALKHRWFYDAWAHSNARISTLGAHTTQIMLDSLGLKGPITPVLPGEVEACPDTAGAIAVCTGVGHPLKAWVGWNDLYEYLVGQGRRVIQVGGADDPTLPGIESYCGLGLMETARLLKSAATLITAEGAMHHLAAAVGCPTYVLCGPTPEVSFVYPGQVAVSRPGCHPCFWSIPTWTQAACAIGEPTCTRLPTVKDVVRMFATVDWDMPLPVEEFAHGL